MRLSFECLINENNRETNEIQPLIKTVKKLYIIAVFVLAIVNLKNSSPIRQEKKMRETGSMHGHENIRIVSLIELLDERRVDIVRDQLELDIGGELSFQLLNKLLLIENVTILCAAC